MAHKRKGRSRLLLMVEDQTMSSGNNDNYKQPQAYPPISDSYLEAQKAPESWVPANEAASLLSKLLGAANENLSGFQPPSGFYPAKFAPPTDYSFGSLNNLVESCTPPKHNAFEPLQGFSNWTKLIPPALPAYETLNNKWSEPYVPPKFEPTQGISDWLKPAPIAWDAANKFAESCAQSANNVFRGQPWESKHMDFGGIDASLSKYLEDQAKVADRIASLTSSAPYLRSAAAPQIEQVAKMAERVPAQAKAKVVPVNPVLETNKLLRELLLATEEARDAATLERAENRKLARENAELKVRIAELESKTQAVESHQHLLEEKLDELLTVTKVMHCNLETVASFAKDVRESFGGPPINLPPIDPSEQDNDEG